MKKRLYRKGYFFLLDSVLALTILAISLFLLFSDFSVEPDPEQVDLFSSDVMDFFAGTKFSEINNQYAGVGGTLWQEGQITNADNTILQQLGIFYNSGNITVAEKMIINLTHNRIPSQYYVEVKIDGTLVYPQGPSMDHNNSKNTTELLLPSRTIVHGFVDEETGETFGPYQAEVVVWQAG